MATTKNTHTGNGSLTTFSFTFPYIKQSDVKVNVDNELVSTGYSFSDATHVQFDTAPATGKIIDIYRSTDDSNLVATFYPGSAIRSSDLNDNFTQNLYTTQETTNDSADALDNSRELSDGVYTSAISIANSAKTTAQNSIDDATAAKQATDRLVATTSDGGSTWTLAGGNTNASTDPKGVKYAIDQIETYVHDGTNPQGDGIGGNPQGVKYAIDTADTAKNTADAADVIADNAKLATDRLVATTSDGGSTWTLTGNNTNASTDPKGVGYAVTTADAATVTAGDAETNATAALNNSRESDGGSPPVYTSAISIANDAKATANAASTAVGNALLYTLKDNKTQFEAVTFDDSEAHEAWEITDSTGISSTYTGFTDNGGSGTAHTVSGIPSNFTGDSGLSARFTYVHNSSGGTFTWAGYWVNDAETRYVVLGPATGSAPQSLSTTAANLPSGTTAQRPASPVSGMFRYNTTEDEFEGYDGTEWGKVGGGLVTIDGGNFTLGTSLVHTTESYDGGSFN